MVLSTRSPGNSEPEAVGAAIEQTVVVEGFNGVFVSTRENFFFPVVVLNTEICTCRLQFLWGAVFF